MYLRIIGYASFEIEHLFFKLKNLQYTFAIGKSRDDLIDASINLNEKMDLPAYSTAIRITSEKRSVYKGGLIRVQ